MTDLSKSALILSFDDFWFYYPRKTAKAAARKAWNKLKPSVAVMSDILNNIKARAESGEWHDKKFIPHPATYLNGERWEDEVIQKSVHSGHQSLQQDLTDNSWAE